MKVYGKVLEHRAALFEAVCPYTITVANQTNEDNKGTTIPWPASTNELELYDDEAYLYDPNDPYGITVIVPGVYDISYRILTNQFRTSTRHTPETSIWLTAPNNDPVRVDKTRTYSYLRSSGWGQRDATNAYTGPIKILHANTRIELDIRVHRTNAVRIHANNASISLRKLRPILDKDHE